MRRSHVEQRSKRYAPVQNVADTHSDKKDVYVEPKKLNAKDIFDAIVLRLRARGGTGRHVRFKP